MGLTVMVLSSISRAFRTDSAVFLHMNFRQLHLPGVLRKEQSIGTKYNYHLHYFTKLYLVFSEKKSFLEINSNNVKLLIKRKVRH